MLRTRAIAFVTACLLLLGTVAIAQPVLTGIEAAAPLPVVAQKGDVKVYSVQGGTSVQIAVTASFSDGSTQDVSGSGATYLSLAPMSVTVGSTGLASFVQPAGVEPALVQVQYGSLTTHLTFHLEP